MANRADDLQAQLTQLGKSLHALIVSRQYALNTGQTEAANQLAVQIQNTAQAYNNIVTELRQIEGPSTALAMLDKVGDVIIGGIKTGATVTLTAAGQVVSAAGSTAAGLGTLAKIIPWALVLLVIVVGIGFYRGSLQAKVATPGTS